MSFVEKYVFVKFEASLNFIIYLIRRMNRNLFLASISGLFVSSYFVFWRLSEFNFLGKILFVYSFLYCIFLVVSALRFLFFPSQHKSYKYLSSFGDPHYVAKEIQREFRERNLRIGGTYFTKSWFLHISWADLEVLMLGEIIWAYARLTKNSVNFVPTGTDKHVIIQNKVHEQPIEINCTDPELEALLYHLKVRLPWIILGYSEELLSLWESNRSKFMENVSERQTQFIEAYKKEKHF